MINLTLDVGGILSESDDGASTRLTEMERAVIIAIADRKGGLISKEGLLSEVYPGAETPEGKSIDVFICRIRQKLSAVGAEHVIQTVFAQGYRWTNKVQLHIRDRSFASVEFDRKMIERIEDLAFASDCTISVLLGKIISDNISTYEKEIWNAHNA